MDELRVATTWAEVTPLGTPTLYWDINGRDGGAGGATPSGTWDGSTTNWNNAADGTGNALPWTTGAAARSRPAATHRHLYDHGQRHAVGQQLDV